MVGSVGLVALGVGIMGVGGYNIHKAQQVEQHAQSMNDHMSTERQSAKASKTTESPTPVEKVTRLEKKRNIEVRHSTRKQAKETGGTSSSRKEEAYSS